MASTDGPIQPGIRSVEYNVRTPTSPSAQASALIKVNAVWSENIWFFFSVYFKTNVRGLRPWVFCVLLWAFIPCFGNRITSPGWTSLSRFGRQTQGEEGGLRWDGNILWLFFVKAPFLSASSPPAPPPVSPPCYLNLSSRWLSCEF